MIRGPLLLAPLLAGMLAAALAAAAPAPAPAPAKPAPAGGGAVSSLKGHNANAPVDVDADRIEVQDRADRAIFTGNVRARQSEMTLTAARMTVAYTGGSDNTQIQRLDASGDVVVVSPTEKATGDFGIYDLDKRLITMLGRVTLTRGDNVVHGGRLLIDLNSGRSTVDGAPVGGGGSGAAAGRGGRVTGHFTVPQRDTTTTTPAKPAPDNKPTG